MRIRKAEKMICTLLRRANVHQLKLIIFCSLFVISEALPSLGLATTFYADPNNGKMAYDGLAPEWNGTHGPWKTLQEVFENGKIGNPVRPGDTILLRAGYHGEIVYSNAHNSDYITIQAQPGHNPGLRRIESHNASKWIFRGLTISPELAPIYKPNTFVHIGSGCNHIVIEHCNIYSVQDASEWDTDDWASLRDSARYAIEI